MRHRTVLHNRNVLVRVLENSAEVVVHISIVSRGENGDDGREVVFEGLAVHEVSGV